MQAETARRLAARADPPLKPDDSTMINKQRLRDSLESMRGRPHTEPAEPEQDRAEEDVGSCMRLVGESEGGR
jgi:hypothetical protein